MVSLVRVMQGEIKPGDKILVMSTGRVHQVDAVGVFTPKRKELAKLGAGEVGWLNASIKDVHGAPVGDTLTLAANPATEAAARLPEDAVARVRRPVPGRRRGLPRRCARRWTSSSSTTPRCNFEPESSEAMGFGFRCGFLGMLHMEIVQERLEREYDLNLITTAPTVIYEVLQTDGTVIPLDNPAKLPPVNKIQEIREPIIHATILTPPDYVGSVIKLCEEKRGMPVEHQLPGQPGADQLRAADGRSGAGLLRQAQVGVARLRLAGLPLPALRGRARSCAWTC